MQIDDVKNCTPFDEEALYFFWCTYVDQVGIALGMKCVTDEKKAQKNVWIFFKKKND